MIKLKFCVSILVLLLLTQYQSKIVAQTIESKMRGNWYCEEMDKSKINFYKEADGYWYAKIIASEAKEYIGKILIEKAKNDTRENALIGTLIRPSNGMQVNATITLESDTKIKIVGRKWMITKTFYWILL